jgi:putative sugar O-methyltransferase
MGLQVPHDLALLTTMMGELREADLRYQPTNYWTFYEKRFLPELRKHGLVSFRRRRGSVLGAFGASDLCVRGELRPTGRFRGAGRLADLLDAAVRHLPFVRLVSSIEDPAWVTEYFYHRIQAKFAACSLDMRRCPTTRFGDPEDAVEIDGGTWSTRHLEYCSQVADAARYIRFDRSAVICELGTGMGRNVEILAGLLDGATVLLFDIPPQLYVCNQYLRSVLGERVIDYRDATQLSPDETGALPPGVRGKVIILPTWRMPAWSAVKIDVFWNSASFQEMEPDVVDNYLSLVKKMRPEFVYINAIPEGNYWGEWRPGRGGTKARVEDALYAVSLGSAYKLVAEYPTDYFLRKQDYVSHVWRRIE